jgi:hypothetical protein
MRLGRNTNVERVEAELHRAPKTQPELRKATGLNNNQVASALKALDLRGILVRNGEGRKHVYRLRASASALAELQNMTAREEDLINSLVNGHIAKGHVANVGNGNGLDDVAQNRDGWSIAACGDLLFETEVGEGLYVPRNRISALVEFLERTRPLWSSAPI